MAPAFFQANGVPLTPEKLPIVQFAVTYGLERSLELIEDDFMTEVDAIVANLGADLAENGVQ